MRSLDRHIPQRRLFPRQESDPALTSKIVQNWFTRCLEQRVAAVTSLPVDLPDGALVEALGDSLPQRSEDAYYLLLSRGESVVPAVRAGLRHANDTVRYQCCRVLDHYLTDEVLPDLTAMLDDSNPLVLCQVLHTLTCERCKEGTCRPDAAVVLAGALRLLAHDQMYVRSFAIEVVGAAVHDSPEALAALIKVRATDPSPVTRKKAGWYLPGGTIYKRIAPRSARVAL